MIVVDNIKIPAVGDFDDHLRKAILSGLGLSDEDLSQVVVQRRSLDARKKPDVFYLVKAAIKLSDKKEAAILKKKRFGKITVSRYKSSQYRLPRAGVFEKRPIVVGAGPAGLFCAYILAQKGAEPLILERGRSIEKRNADVRHFFETGVLDTDSNVVFGEGGAGAFSDGKLNTGVKDKYGRAAFIKTAFAECGAPGEIIYDNRPHIGTDRLLTVIAALREKIKDAGGEFRFESRVDKVLIHDSRVCGVRLSDGEELHSDVVVLAIGHSARDTYRSLLESGIAMEAKPFAVGVRIEHPRAMIDGQQYGEENVGRIAAASYRLTSQAAPRPVYTFCMCPGGYVVNSSSEQGMLCVNGMSNEARDSENSNSAVVCAVGAESFDISDPMAGIRFQRELETKAFKAGGGRIPQQLFDDFRNDRISTSYGGFSSLTEGDAVFGDVRGILGDDISGAVISGITDMAKRLRGFDAPDSVLSGVESRTSAPVRILRGSDFMSDVSGLYPCGEGAGYAGGIMSAAMDGIKIAEAICKRTMR